MKKRKRPSTFLGVDAEAVGITLEGLEANDVVRVDDARNGLILDIYRKVTEKERFNKPYSRTRWTGWIRTIVGIPDNIGEELISDSVLKIFKQRDHLRRARLDSEKKVLDDKVFTVIDTDGFSPDSAQTVVEVDRTHVIERSMNALEQEIVNKKKHLKKLQAQCTKLRCKMLKHNVMYRPKNVQEREKRKDAKIKTLRSALDKSNARLVEQAPYILRLRSSKSFWKKKALVNSEIHNKISNTSNGQTKRIQELEEEVHSLNQKAALDTKDGHIPAPRLVEDGIFTDNVRRCVMELVSFEVATDKVPLVIECVSKHVFNHNISKRNLPQRQTVLKITDESQYIVKTMYSELICQATHFGLHKDGTSRKKQKILGNSLTLSSKEVLPLGFRHIASETAATITKIAKKELKEVASCGKTVVSQIVKKLTYVMSDRAANEKLSNKQIGEWKQELLSDCDNEEERVTVHSFYCMVHVLLGFHTYGVKNLDAVQKEVEVSGIKFGRDGQVPYRREVAGPRTVRITSDLLGPVPDEKNGQRERWMAYCRLNKIKSMIGNYKDNRFNCLFETAAQVLHHRKDITKFYDNLDCSNLKLKSSRLDLIDEKIAAILTSLAAIYYKITGPYWDAMTSGHCNYLALHEYIQPMYCRIIEWIEAPATMLMEDDAPLFEDFPGRRTSPMFQAAMKPPEDMDYFEKCTSAILQGMKECCNNQLADFLTGHLSQPTDDSSQSRVSGAPLNNISSERDFGTLDASQQRRRNATLHFHTSLLLLK